VSLNYHAPPKHWALRPGEVTLCSVPLAASPACITYFERSLVPRERDQALSFRTTALREAYVIARGTLRVILGRCVNLPAEDVPLVYGAYGKPLLTDKLPLDFNLSHSGGRALYSLSLDRETGVDLEKISTLPDCEKIAQHFFSADETRDLLSLPPDQRNEAFFACWTRKEAYIKACGEGLSMALDGFRVSLLPSEPPRLETPSDPRLWSLHDVSPAPGYAAALVTAGTAPRLHAWLFDDAEECAGYFR
jgi:4'-phosphopantetheinyl transferase